MANNDLPNESRQQQRTAQQLQAALEAIPSARVLNIPTVSRSWELCVKDFLASLYERGEQAATIQFHRKALVDFFSSISKSPESISPDEIVAYGRSKRGYGQVVGAFYRFANDYQWPADEPARTFPHANLDQEDEQPDFAPVPKEQPDFAQLPADWQTCIAHYLQSIYELSRSDNSLEMYTRILVLFFAHMDKRPDQVTRKDIDSFLACRFRGGSQSVAASTRNFRLAVLRGFYDFAAGYQVSGPDGQEHPLFDRANPAKGIRPGRAKQAYRALSEDEIRRFFEAIPSDTTLGIRDRAFFLLAFCTSRRREELCRFTWGSISRGMIDGHEAYIYTFRQKGRGTAYEKMELPALAYAAIERYLVESGRMATIKPEDPLFLPVGPQGLSRRTDLHAPLSSRTMYAQLKRYAAVAGIPLERICLHSWRHSAIQQRLLAGQPLLEVMQVSGHKNLNSFYTYCTGLTGQADTGASVIAQKFGNLVK